MLFTLNKHTLRSTDRYLAISEENLSETICIDVDVGSNLILLDKVPYIEFENLIDNTKFSTTALDWVDAHYIYYSAPNGILKKGPIIIQLVFREEGTSWIWKSLPYETTVAYGVNVSHDYAYEYPDFISDVENQIYALDQKKQDWLEPIQLLEPTSSIPMSDVALLKKNTILTLDYDGHLYSLTARSGPNWTYCYVDKTDGSIHSITVDTTNGSYTTIQENPVEDMLLDHIHNTEVHIQPGERNFWNNKVTASVEEQNEKLIITKR